MKRDRRRHLDGVRGLAIFLVLLSHLTVRNEGPGLVGVLLFFVLSGYLITSLLMRESREWNGVNVRDFYIRRVLRLGPALAVFLAVFLVVALTVDVGVTSHRALMGALLGATYMTDFALGLQKGFTPELAHLWSLAVEEHFYLIWPFAVGWLAGVDKARRLRLVVLAVLGFMLVRMLTVVATAAYPFYVYALPTTWGDALLIGALVAIARPPTASRRRLAPATGLAVTGVGLILLLGGAFWPGMFRALWTYAYGIPLMSLGAALVILGLDGSQPHALTWVFRTRPVVALGVLSYSVYLYNSTAILLLQHVYGHGYLQRSAALLVAILCAALSYRFVEQPFLRLKERFTKPSVTRDAAHAVTTAK